jgi:aminoglycoside phosphotransferase (APT) family kinase protein
MLIMAMHEDQLHVGKDIVRRLVDKQFPQWRDLDVREVSTAGTVNAIFRIGTGLAARFPLRGQDPIAVRGTLTAEADAARELTTISTVPTPTPVAIGEPGCGYPMPWCVQTWLPGDVAMDNDPAGSLHFAADLAAFIGALRGADARGRGFDGMGRGGHLADHDEWMEICFRESEALVDVGRLRAMWAEFRTLPEVDADAMCHGDITPPNVLVRDGRLVGMLDGGGFAAADPAIDLVGAWHLLDDLQRKLVRDALNCSDVQWRRGMAWALQQSMGLVWYYAESNPSMSHWSRRTLDRLVRASAG